MVEFLKGTCRTCFSKPEPAAVPKPEPAAAPAVEESLRQYTAARNKEAVVEAERQAAARNQKKKDRARKQREADTARANAAKKKSIRAASISAVGRIRINQDDAAVILP